MVVVREGRAVGTGIFDLGSNYGEGLVTSVSETNLLALSLVMCSPRQGYWFLVWQGGGVVGQVVGMVDHVVGVRSGRACKELGGGMGPRCHHAPVSTPRGPLVQLVKGRSLHWGSRTTKQHTRGGSQAFLPCLESIILKTNLDF